MRSLVGAVSAVAIFVASASSAAAQPTFLISSEDAYVVQDSEARTWSIGNRGIAYTIGFGSNGSLHAFSLSIPGTERAWDLDAVADASFELFGRRMPIGSVTDGMIFRGSSTFEKDGGVGLSFVFELRDRDLKITRTYVCYPTAPVVEAWTTFDGNSMGLPISEIELWHLGVEADYLNWVTGLDATQSEGGSFTRRRREIVRDPFRIGATGRSSERVVPVFWLDGAEGGTFFGGVLWSGGWSVDVAKSAVRAQVSIATGELSTTVYEKPIEMPHAFFGATAGDATEISRAIADFVDRGIRHGRPFRPLVTYNTWFTYGIDIDEESMRDEMAYAADFGAELFVLDAGWYVGGSEVSDFTTGLGSWTVDAKRFPSGLRSLGEHAHSLGLQFGLWVEPERVAMSTVGRAGLANEGWLAMTGGRYDPGVRNESAGAAQVCLASAEARRWLLDRLFSLIDEVRPDYLKWDNNFWINCSRTGHGHGVFDGGFAHVQGLYEIFAALRQRYPDMLIENCSGGGRRLDLEILRYTDVGWMDDLTAPSLHVRHNLEGLATLFPPAYLFSFVMAHEAELLRDSPDLSLIFRSRMPGILGLTFQGGSFLEGEVEQIKREIRIYKVIRDILADGTSLLLTPQAGSGSQEWDAVEVVSRTTTDAVVFAYDNPQSLDRIVVRLGGLDPNQSYEMYSVDGGPLGAKSGQVLMDEGLEVVASPVSAGQIIVLRRTVPVDD